MLIEILNLIQITWTGDFLGYTQTLGLNEDSTPVGVMLAIHALIF